MHNMLIQQGLTILLLIIFAFMLIGLGRLALYKNNIHFHSSGEIIFFSAGLGFGIVGYAVFFLGLFNGFYSFSIGLLLACLLIMSLAGWFWVEKPPSHFTNQKPCSQWEKLLLILLFFCLIMGLLLSLTPEIGKDALIYHLAVPKLFLNHHGFYFIQGNVFAHYPLHSEMLYLIGLLLQGDILAKGIHFLAHLFILLGMYHFIRFNMEMHNFPALSLILFCTIPSVFLISHMAYNDLFVTLYTMGAVFAFIKWSRNLEKGWLFLSSVFTGFAIASKYTALFLPSLGFFGVVWVSHQNCFTTRRTLYLLLIYGCILIITGSPFYIKNWIITGNPFYPFLYGIFGGRGWEPAQAQYYDFFVQTLGMGRTFFDYILLPWNLSIHAKMDSPQFDGIIGPVFILTLPFAIMLRKFDNILKIITVYCLLTFMFWASSAQQIRYLIPIFPFLAIYVGAILTHYQRNKLAFVVLLLFISGGLAHNGWHIFHDYINVKPVNVVIGKENRDVFLKRMLPSYAMFDFINSQLPQNSKIFLIYMKNWTFLCDKECYSDSMFESYTIQKILSQASTPANVFVKLTENGFSHLLFDIKYIYGRLSTLTPAEQNLFRTFTNEHLELVRADQSYLLYRIK